MALHLRRMITVALLAISLVVSGGTAATAADDYNVGDRVEYDLFGTGQWEKGVVIQESAEAYLVRSDSRSPGTPGGEYTIPKSPTYEARIRRSSAPLPTDQKRNTSLPTGILDCPYEKGIASAKVRRGTFEGLIRCLYEYKDGVGSDGLGNDSRFDITSMKVGRSRPWRVNIDIGAGDLDTRIYPVKVKWKQTWWTDTEVVTKTGTSIYGCFYSTLDEWECGLNQRVSDTPFVRQPRLATSDHKARLV